MRASSRPSSPHSRSRSRAAAGWGRRLPTAPRSSGSRAIAGAEVLVDTGVPSQGRRLLPGPWVSGGESVRPATAAASCSRSTASREAQRHPRGLVLVRERACRRPVGNLVWPAHGETSPGGTTATGRVTLTRSSRPGAFPEPFVHGYDGKVRPAAVRYAPGLGAGGERIARAIGTNDIARWGRRQRVPRILRALSAALPVSSAGMRKPGSGPSGAVVFLFAGPIDALLEGRTHGSSRAVSARPRNGAARRCRYGSVPDRPHRGARRDDARAPRDLPAGAVQRRWLYIGGSLSAPSR